MPAGGSISERVLILTALGRDSRAAAVLLAGFGLSSVVCDDAAGMVQALDAGAGFAILSEEAITDAVAHGLIEWSKAQPPWSDLPFIVLTSRSDVPEHNNAAQRLRERSSNVTFLEQPFHPTTLASMANTALNSRRKQYQARDLLGRYEILARELQHRTKNLLKSSYRSPPQACPATAGGMRFSRACTRSQRLRSC